MTEDGAGRSFDVGVIGLGRMGGPIAKNLVRGGLAVCGFDLEPGRLSSFVGSGGVAAESIPWLACHTPIVLTLLPSAAALANVVERICSAADQWAEPPLLVEMSTLGEDTKQLARERLASVGVETLDCPVSGTAVQAAAGDLVIYASGDERTIDQCMPVFQHMARSVHRLGGFGVGTKTKLVANLLIAVHIVVAAEALVVARAAGLDLATTLAALVDGAGTSRMLEVRGPMMVSGDFETPSMTLGLFEKDEKLIRGFAAELGVSLPIFEVASRELRHASANGYAEHDTSAVFASKVAAVGPRPTGGRRMSARA